MAGAARHADRRRGNDTYLVDNAGDAVFENENNGSDQVQTSINYGLAST